MDITQAEEGELVAPAANAVLFVHKINPDHFIYVNNNAASNLFGFSYEETLK